jgi:hypothetical protein
MPCIVLYSMRSIETVTSARRELTEAVPKTHEDDAVTRVRPCALLPPANALPRPLYSSGRRATYTVLSPRRTRKSRDFVSPVRPSVAR